MISFEQHHEILHGEFTRYQSLGGELPFEHWIAKIYEGQSSLLEELPY